MSSELSIESLAKNIEEVKMLVAGIKTAEEDKEKKDHEAKKAMDEDKEKEKMEAKKAKYDAAIKTAMEEDDHDKKDAAIKKAQDEYDDKKHEAFGKPDEHKAMHEEDEKKDHEAQIASIIQDKKNSLINQILTANRVINPQGLAKVEARLKTASITEIQKELDIVKPFIGGVDTTMQPSPQEKFIPFYANITPADIDVNQLTASSPDSDFNKMTTKELLEMGR